MADIELTAGIKGGGKITGSSAVKIQNQLNNIIGNIVKRNPIELKVKLNENSLKEVEKTIKSLYKSADATTSKNGTKILTQGVNGYRAAVEKVVSTLKTARANAKKWTAADGDVKVGPHYENIQKQIDALENLQTKLSKGKLTVKQFNEEFDKIKVSLAGSYDAISKHGLDKKKGDDFKKYKQQLSEVNTMLEKVEQNVQDWSRAEKDSGVSGGAYRDLEVYAARLRDIQTELLKTGTYSEETANELKELIANITTAGTKIDPFYKRMTMGTKALSLVDQLGSYVSTIDAFYKIVQIGGDMVEAVTDIDTAMTELRKVTDETDATYSSFLKNASTRAQDFGTTVADIVSATADFARLGHSIEDASALADVATIYKNVGDGISDIETASSSIISTMQAFGIEAQDAMSIVDSFNAVGR